MLQIFSPGKITFPVDNKRNRTPHHELRHRTGRVILPGISCTLEIFVDNQRTDVTAGQNAHLVIFDNGAAVISTRTASTEFSLNRTDLDRIIALFALAQYPALSTNYPASRPGADLTNYSISYQNMTITLQETAIPPVIQPVLDELNRIVA
ncbi:MAG: hypothetical protein WC406_05035, partial [Methanoregula sp.]